MPTPEERERELVDRVATSLLSAELSSVAEATWQDLARAAISAIREHETCASCGHKLDAVTKCLECQLLERSQTP